jgi:cytochrome P450
VSPVPIPLVPALTPWQQWQYFSQPRKMHDWLRQTYGPIAPLAFQGRRYAAILSPEGARQAFSADPDGYDAFWKESFAGMNGENSLWVLIGEPHRRERALFAPAVHARHFRQYGGVIRDIARQKFDAWQPGQTLRAIDTTLAISLEVIMRLVFGVEGEDLPRRGREVIHALTHSAHPLIVFYPRLQRSWFPLFRRYTRAKTALYAWMDEVMAARRARPDPGDDVLASLLGARDEAGRPYTDEHICNELLSVLSAGHMTTAVALAWALYELGRHPQVVAKLRAELDAAGSDPDPITTLALPYLSAICNETIRLHPILAECARVPMQPVEILGYIIPAGQALVISIVGIHHDPALYPEPDRFRPERFIEREYDRFEFLPFGGGHRRCLGAGLAEYTLRLAVAEAVRAWDFEAAAVDRDIRHDLAMGPKLGVPLRVLARRPARHSAATHREPLAVAS